jgi:hypothetical protein
MSAGIEDRIRFLAWIGWSPHSWGVFRTANGNAWLLNFWIGPTQNGNTGAHILSSYTGWEIVNTLTGYFWMETIGWVGGWKVNLYPDPSWDPRANWTLSGYLWNDSAGWVDMNRVVFVPDNTSFSGFAWNDGIGWIDVWWATLASTSSWFIGKVKVLWSVWWARVFNTVYSISQWYSSVNVSSMINKIKKNLTIQMRNAWPNQINQVWTQSIELFKNSIIFQNTGSTVSLVRYSDTSFLRVGFEDVRTIVVVWANIYIDEAVIVRVGDKRPRAIIALANDQWIGWNIYIAWNPTRIESSLIAAGSIFSAYFPESTSTDYIYYNANASSTIALPDRQLYVFGSLISHNTIGGANPSNGLQFVCPYLEVDCKRETAIKYDFNYFRDFQKDPVKRWYSSNIYDDFSVIVEYNPLIIRDPPPLLLD